MDQVINQLAEVHRDQVTFVKVEAEAVPEVSEKLEVAMVPTCVLLKGDSVCGKVEGADPPELSKRVQDLASERVSEEKASGAGGQGLSPELRAKLEELTSASPVMLFMKGNGQQPKCKFSRKMVELLKGAGVDFGSFDILTDEEVRAGLKVFSNLPTFPQLYVRGVLVGGVDDTVKLAEKGDLKTQLGAAGGFNGTMQVVPAAGEGAKSVRDRCKELIASANTMIFMKGTPDAPRCGFSRTLISILREEGIEFKSFDILEDPGVRQELKDLSNWPTYPQLYVKGELVGGLDIVREMKAEGPLASQLELTTKESLEAKLKGLISSGKVMLFMKGDRDEPKCGFSRSAVELLRGEGVDFRTFDILEDDQVRQGLKKLSDWPTYPQLYVDGELLGGLDIMKEMAQAGELGAALRREG